MEPALQRAGVAVEMRSTRPGVSFANRGRFDEEAVGRSLRSEILRYEPKRLNGTRFI